MSDQTVTFTIQDLVSEEAKVVDAVHRLGSVDLRTQEGEMLVLRKKDEPKPVAKQLPDFEARWKRLRELGNIPPSPAENERINRIIAGET